MKQHALGLKRRRENQANQITVRSGSSLFAILYIQLCLIINIMLNRLVRYLGHTSLIKNFWIPGSLENKKPAYHAGFHY